MLYKNKKNSHRDRSNELSCTSDGNKSSGSQRSSTSTALLKSIQALGKSSKGQRIQIYGSESIMPKILNGKDFERGYTSTESYKLREKNMPDLNLAKYNNKALNSDEKKMYQNNRTGGLLGID